MEGRRDREDGAIESLQKGDYTDPEFSREMSVRVVRQGLTRKWLLLALGEWKRSQRRGGGLERGSMEGSGASSVKGEWKTRRQQRRRRMSGHVRRKRVTRLQGHRDKGEWAR